jgi:hypothetical protein
MQEPPLTIWWSLRVPVHGVGFRWLVQEYGGCQTVPCPCDMHNRILPVTDKWYKVRGIRSLSAPRIYEIL